jgi:hypothetical protein
VRILLRKAPDRGHPTSFDAILLWIRLRHDTPVCLTGGATWVALRDDEDDPAPDGPEPTFGTGEPPVSEGTWAAPGY